MVNKRIFTIIGLYEDYSVAVKDRGPDKDEKNTKKTPGALLQLVTIGATLVGSTFTGLIIGVYLDRFFNSSPWLTIISLLMGIAAGFINIYKMAKKYGTSS